MRRQNSHCQLIARLSRAESPPPEALQGFIDSELVRWGKVVKSAGLAGTE
jgi:hypothetical protein